MRRTHLAGIAIVSALATIASPTAIADPFTWGENATNVRWPEGKTITFWVPSSADSNGNDRAPFVREGIRRWQTLMAERGITIAVPDVEPPADTANLVKVEFKPAGTSLEGTDYELGEEAKGIAGPEVYEFPLGSGNMTITGGEIILLDTLKAKTDDQKHFLRNLAAHEVCHVLGLDDDPEGSVTKHDQPFSDITEEEGTDDNGFNEKDREEINTLYPKVEEEEPARADGELEQKQAGYFEYRFTYVGHKVEGHVPLIVMQVDPDVIVDVNCPPGWLCLNPADPMSKSLDYPYYQDQSITTARPFLPWDPCVRAPLAFRAPSSEVDLRASNPEVVVGFFAHSYQVGLIEVWAGGETQFLPGPVPLGHDCVGDLNGDGVVNTADLLIMFSEWGPCGDDSSCFADLNGDGVVAVGDLLILFDGWGQCPPAPLVTVPCCLDDDLCLDVTAQECFAAGGTFAGSLCTCAEVTCGNDADQAMCADDCGAMHPDGCWCDQGCVFHGDCCSSDCDSCPSTCCPWDVTGNGIVGSEDLALCLASVGPCEPGLPCPCDFNRDGEVDEFDLELLTGHWGPCPQN
jgi:hypothetical protein